MAVNLSVILVEPKCVARWLSLTVLGVLSMSTLCLAAPQDDKVKSQSNAATLSVDEDGKAPARILRHAVFFKFKEATSEEDVKKIVDAFQSLPSKIKTITDLRFGTNNSPEGHDDGFTHCFLLSFKDEQGRKTYLPHADHAAFGSLLKPHLDKVFVVDYWGTPEKRRYDKPLKHAVFFKFKEDADPAAVKKVEEAFAALPAKIDSIRAFEWGTNNSPEGLNDGFTHCFMVTFDSESGRAAYLPHADHEAFVEVLMPVLDKVRVLDFWAEE